jgi:hypothetical protein
LKRTRTSVFFATAVYLADRIALATCCVALLSAYRRIPAAMAGTAIAATIIITAETIRTSTSVYPAAARAMVTRTFR